MKNLQIYITKAQAVCWLVCYYKQESPAVADKPARRLQKVCMVYVRAVGL